MVSLTKRGSLIKKNCIVHEQVHKEFTTQNEGKTVKRKEMTPKRSVSLKEDSNESRRQEILKGMEMECEAKKVKEPTEPVSKPIESITEEETTIVHTIDISDMEIEFILDMMYNGIQNMEETPDTTLKDRNDMLDIMDSSLSPITKLGSVLRIGLKL